MSELVINSMYVTRDPDGTINLFGAHHIDSRNIIVLLETKNVSGIGQKLYGEKYTDEYLIEHMKKNPTHSFIGRIYGPLSFPCPDEYVTFK